MVDATPRQLKYFVEVVESGSLSGASHSLCIAQPALSQHIAAMEEVLGVKLFERHARGMKPTAEGVRLYERARSILRQISLLKDDIRDSGDLPRGEVRLGIAGALAGVMVAPLLRGIESEYPDIRLSLTDGLSTEMATLIESRMVDLALFPSASEIEGMESLPVLTEHLYLFGSVDLLGGEAGPIPFAAIGAQHLAAPDRTHDLRKMMEREAAAQNLRLDVRYELNSPAMILSVVREGLACAVLPRSTYPDFPQAGPIRARLITHPGLTRVQSIVWPSDRSLSSAALAVKKILIKAARTVEEKGQS